MYIRKELEKENTNSKTRIAYRWTFMKNVDQTNHVIDIVILLTEDHRSEMEDEGF